MSARFELWEHELTEEFQGTLDEFMNAIHPDDRAGVRNAYFGSLNDGADSYEIEHRIVRSQTGEIRFVQEKGVHQRDTSGRAVASVGMVQDITDRKRADECIFLLAHMSDNAPGFIMVHDSEGRILYANHRTLEMHGHSAEELEHMRLQELRISGGDSHGSPGVCLDDAVDEANLEVVHRRKDGSTFPLQVHMKRIDWGGKPALLSIGTDISRLKQAEQALARAKDAAEAANQAKTEFLANMSHDLRTPLNGIMGMLQVLHGTGLNEEQSQFVSKALRSSEQLTELLADLLDLSRIEAGKLEIRQAAFTINELFDSVSDLFGIAAGRKGILLDRTIDESLSVKSLVGDAARVRQVLFNLVGNALKFTNKGGIRMRAIPVPPKGKHERRVRFSVSDTGIGISEGTLKQIFTPFGRSSGGGGIATEGTGLGLSIVKRLVDMMGGTFTITSKLGRGTTVSFELPLQPAFAAPSPQRGESADVERAGRLRILVAEDDELNRIVTQRLLEKEGHSVTAVEDGRAALDMFTAQEFDCIIMDIQMPVMGGVEATKAIREGKLPGAKTDVPIIALTAYAMREDQRKFLEAGVNECLTKPVKLDKLKKALTRVREPEPA